MIRLSLVLAAVAAAAAVMASTQSADAVAITRCGTVTGPTAHVGRMTTDHYTVIGYEVDCGFAKSTVAGVVKQSLPNSKTPVRAKAPTGWICIAQEVDSHVAVTGHCQRGRSSALSWVAAGLHG